MSGVPVPNKRSVYECVFYTKKLGLKFKFVKDKAVVTGYDEKEYLKGIEEEKPKVIQTTPQKLGNKDKYSIAKLKDLSRKSEENNEANKINDKGKEKIIEDVKEVGNNSDVLAAVEEEHGGVVEEDEGEMYKLLLECDEVFGKGTKKVCKMLLRKQNNMDADAKNRVLELSDTVREKYTFPNNKELLFRYFDHDLEQMIDLDKESWNEFLAEVKKKLTIFLGNEVVMVPTPTLSSAMDEQKEERGQPIYMPEEDLKLKKMLADSVPEPLPEKESVAEFDLEPMPTNADDASTPAWMNTETADVEAISAAESTTLDARTPSTAASALLMKSIPRPVVGSYLLSINHVKVIGLDKDTVLGLLKQSSRPMILEFVYEEVRDNIVRDSNATAASDGFGVYVPSSLVTHRPDVVEEYNADGVVIASSIAPTTSPLAAVRTPNKNTITFEQFMSKYNHSSAAAMRKSMDKYIHDYLNGDWFSDNNYNQFKNTVANSRTNSAASQHSAKRSSIGTDNSDNISVTPSRTIVSLYKFVQQKMDKLGLFDNTKAQGGGLPDMQEEQWDNVQDHIEAFICSQIYSFTIKDLAMKYNYSPVDLRGKLSSLRFLTLEHMGLYNVHRIKYAGVFKNRSNYFNPPTVRSNALSVLSENEEWRLAMKELCRALEFENPQDIMKRFVSASKIIAHATEAYMFTDEIFEDESQGDCTECDRSAIVSPATKMGFRKQENKASECCDDSNRALSADDLLPAIAWSIVQANPPDIDNILWYCNEFRHPDRMHGEAAYALAQLSSAVEFCKTISAECLDISEADFDCYSQQYELTIDLVNACKRGNLNLMKTCLGAGSSAASKPTKKVVVADINGLNETQTDRPLSTCVRYQQLAAAELLLTEYGDKIHVNARLCPCYGSEQAYTPLHLAAISGQTDMVLLLLRHGADRYLIDDCGDTPLSLAKKAKQQEIVDILMVDPMHTSIVDNIINNKLAAVDSLLLQNVDVNALNDDHTQFALLAAVRSGNLKVINYVLSTGTRKAGKGVYVNVNQTNINNESALMHLPYMEIPPFSLSTSNYESLLVKCCVLLLQEGCNRNLRTIHENEAAIDWCRMELLRLQKLYSITSDSSDTAYIEVEHIPDPAAMTNLSTKSEDEKSISQACKSSMTMVTAISQLPPSYETIKAMEKSLASDCSDRPTLLLRQHKIEEDHVVDFCNGLKRVINILKYDPKHFDLCEVARLKMFDAVKALLDQGVPVNTKDAAKGFTPLVAAIFNNDVDMVRLILEYSGEKVRNRNKFDEKSQATSGKEMEQDRANDDYVHKPYSKSKSELLDINMVCRNGMTALHYAAQSGNPPIVGLLLRYGADRELLNDQKQSPIMLATNNNHAAVVDVLRYDPAVVPINLAAKHGDWSVTYSLLLQGVSVNSFQRHYEKSSSIIIHSQATPLMSAISHNQVDYIKKLFAECSEAIDTNQVNLKGETALMYAAMSGNEAIVLLLLYKGADRYVVDSVGKTAHSIAMQYSYDNIAAILEFDPSVACIHDVIRKNDKRGVIALLKQGVDVNQRRFHNIDKLENRNSNSSVSGAICPKSSDIDATCSSVIIADGELPFTVAAACNCVEIMKLLLKAPDLDINRSDGDGRNALFHAAMNGQVETVLLLLKHRANRKSLDFKRKSACDVAIMKGHLQIAAIIQADPFHVFIHDVCSTGKILLVKALLMQGCPVNFKDERPGTNQITPLIAACMHGKSDLIKMLLKEPDIRIDEQDGLGRTALMMAASVGALNCTVILLSNGCNRSLKDNLGKTAKDYAYSHGVSTRVAFAGQLARY